MAGPPHREALLSSIFSQRLHANVFYRTEASKFPFVVFSLKHHSKCSMKIKVRARWKKLDFISGLLVTLIDSRCVIITPGLKVMCCL